MLLHRVLHGEVSGEVCGEVINKHLTIRKADKQRVSPHFGEAWYFFSIKVFRRIIYGSGKEKR